MEVIHDKIKGMLIGAALGDALGVPHEFKYQKDHYTGVLEHVPYLWNRFQGKRHLALAQLSDDSELTITLARSLVRNQGYNEETVLSSYLQWANSNTPMMGTNTRELLKGVTTYRGYKNRWEKKFMDQPLETYTRSNGALMRCSSLAVLRKNEPIIQDCCLTNPHPVNQDCNLIYVSALKLALSGNANEKIFEDIKTLPQTQDVKDIISQVENKLNRNLATDEHGKSTKGYCLHGLYCALYCLKYFSDYQSSIDWVIGQHPNSDTDTNACITGALVGALLGYTSLNQESRTGKNITILRNCDTNTGELPRPPIYGLSDFDHLTKQLTELYIREHK
jgi:ADP-ribosylglycohydrolase